MRRAVTTGVMTVSILVWTLTAVAASAQDPDFQTFTPATPEEAAITLLPPATPGSAGNLRFSERCSETRRRTAVIALSWRAGEGSGDQRLDFTPFRDGFDQGRYQTSGRLPHGQTAAGVEAPEPGLRYYWRVLTETPAGWIPSAVERFEVPVCPWDEPQPTNPGSPKS